MFKKPVRVYCQNEQELTNLLIWLRVKSGLNYFTENLWLVEAIIPNVLSESRQLRGFYVEIPHALAQSVITPVSVEEAFAGILAGPAVQSD